MRRYKISNEFTLPREYILGEIDSFKILANNKLYENESVSTVDITIEDELEEDRTTDLLIRQDLVKDTFTFINILFKAGDTVDEDEGMKFLIKVEMDTNLDRKIIVNIYFNVK